jgi:hypothetical protein
MTLEDIEIVQVDDIIEEIPEKEYEEESHEEESQEEDDEFDFDDEEGDFIRIDDLGNSVERVVDVLGGIFVSSEGSTMADLLARISDTLERHVLAIEAQTAVLEKQSKVLFRLSKSIEKN